MRLSRRTMLKNNHNAPVVVMAMKNGQVIRGFNVTIPGGEHKYVYYSDLNVEYNYSDVDVIAFLEGSEGAEKSVSTSMVRDNEVIEFNCQDEIITFRPIKGSFLARIG